MSVTKTDSAPDPLNASSVSWRIFTAFMTDQQLSLTKKELRSYVIDELKIHNIPRVVREHLPIIAKTFLNDWTGWASCKHEYSASEEQRKRLFATFQNYMHFRLRRVLVGSYSDSLKELLGGNISRDADKGFAPFAISLQCPANILNCYVFSSEGDDVIMKQHVGPPWQELTMVQLLHWPYIEVTFQTPDIHFVRRQETEFCRYLNALPHAPFKIEENVIEFVESYGAQECYSYDFLENYIKLYMHTIKGSIWASSDKLDEIQNILSEFLKDIIDINVKNSIVTNSLIQFRLSPMHYIRNKKLLKKPPKEGEENRVGYCEKITPKVQLQLVFLKAKQLEGDVLNFEYLEQLKELKSRKNSSPLISYRCTFCQILFTGPHSKKLVIKHFKDIHTMEQPVRCTMCKQQLNVLKLCEERWKHECVTVIDDDSSSLDF